MTEHDDYEANLMSYQKLIAKLVYLTCGTRPEMTIPLARGQSPTKNISICSYYRM